MEGYWGMGRTVSSHAVSTQLGVGTPGGGGHGGKEAEHEMRNQLADRIENKLDTLLQRVEEILTENRREVLAVAHALETRKTMQGDDVVAVIEGREGSLIDGRVYSDPAFAESIEAYHQASLAAHERRGRVELGLPDAPPMILPPLEHEPVAGLSGSDESGAPPVRLWPDRADESGDSSDRGDRGESSPREPAPGDGQAPSTEDARDESRRDPPEN
jgi:hypothetical protein